MKKVSQLGIETKGKTKNNLKSKFSAVFPPRDACISNDDLWTWFVFMALVTVLTLMAESWCMEILLDLHTQNVYRKSVSQEN